MEDDCNCSAEHNYNNTKPTKKNEAQIVLQMSVETWIYSCHVLADSVRGIVKHSHTTQPGQPPYYQTTVAALRYIV